ncbi:hypothetical protein IV203_012740 [Nitzschia inconspicua]|uniref:Uncharacterized protein n=1 Tax=Nitzschia inconspicua TaxID=303405 RepID=A0A9K3K911_9STRA|nr:hypothetical protein IV203_012740 [Nitzschia inconspicua]
MGIPSTTSDNEIDRRRLLRNTYLNYYRDQRIQQSLWSKLTVNKPTDNTTKTTDNTTKTIIKVDVDVDFHPDRICSLHEYTCQHDRYRNHCQLVYVFFVGGGNTTAPTELLDESIITDFRQMLVPTSTVPKSLTATTRNNHHQQSQKGYHTGSTVHSESVIEYTPSTYINVDLYEPGVVYLNIRENQFDGKMTTWFQFASLVGNEFPQLDYATKTWDHPCPLPLVGRSYMSGELNFMSMDLAAYIASPYCPRARLTIPHEDVSLSNYVYSYLNNTKYWKYQQQQKQQQQQQDEDHSIRIVSFNTSRILLTTSMTANWDNVDLRANGILDEMLWDIPSNGIQDDQQEQQVTTNNKNKNGNNRNEQLQTVRQQLAEKMKRQQQQRNTDNKRIRRP